MTAKLILSMLALLSACVSPLDDRRVSRQWAMDVCAELDRSQWRVCMEEGRREAPANKDQTNDR